MPGALCSAGPEPEVVSERKEIAISKHSKDRIHRALFAHKYRLNEVPVGVAGVYYLFDHRGRLIYVGQSKDIADRARRHCSGDERHALVRYYCVGRLASDKRLRTEFIREHCRLSVQPLNPKSEDFGAIERTSIATATELGHPLINGSHATCSDNLDSLILSRRAP